MERPPTPQEKRQQQNIMSVILIAVAIFFFFKNRADILTPIIVLILGLGIGKDVRSVLLFALKWVIAKIFKKNTPTYDFSNAKMTQKSGRDSVINNGTITNVYNK
ncbi:MAG: hypothetical protein AABX11_01600 [Nanoarchaeota archaeon]